LRADDDALGIFCVLEGLVRQYTVSALGEELTLTILKPVAYFPMSWAMNDSPNLYSFEALTNVTVRRAPVDKLMNYINEEPKVTLSLMQELLSEYAEALARIEQLVFSDAYRRVISVMLYLAKHFGESYQQGVIVKHWFTQQDVATLVGVARETANIELVKLERQGLISYFDHSMFFPNMEELSNALSD
jgi:CRP-like cAMP-binding protein